MNDWKVIFQKYDDDLDTDDELLLFSETDSEDDITSRHARGAESLRFGTSFRT